MQLIVCMILTFISRDLLAQCDTDVRQGAGRTAISEIFDCLQNRINELEKPTVVPTVPVGGVIAWWGNWGDKDNRPFGYELCDGEVVYTQNSSLMGERKPDLRGRFIRGADSNNIDEITKNIQGGSDTLAGLITDGHALNKNQMPKHNHGGQTVKDGSHTHTTSGRGASDDEGNKDDYFALGDNDKRRSWPKTGISVDKGNSLHQHRISFEGRGNPHSHVIPQLDNRPNYLELNYLIRVQ